MRFGLSTHLFHGERLGRDQLERVRASGFELIEVFATRTHVDYHDVRAIDDLARTLDDVGLVVNSVHGPICESFSEGVWGRSYSNASSQPARREEAVAETVAAFDAAKRLGAASLVVHLGLPRFQDAAPGDNDPTAVRRSLEAMADARLCLAGAPVAAQRNGAAASAESLVELKPGDVLKLGATRGGARSYLCIEGGFQFPGRLALTRRLGAGEILMAGMSHRGRVASGAEGTPAGDAATIPLRFVLDPRRERFFPPKAIEGFLSTEFRVSSTSDRRGVRLEGIAVGASGSSEVSPEGTMRGTIQIPPDGQPIVLGPDRPLTGGYARLGKVIDADWARLAQAPPGAAVRFSAVTLAQALAAGACGSGPEE